MTLKGLWRKFWRWLLKTYRKEIQALAEQVIKEYVDKATVLTKTEVEKIRSASPDLVKRVIDRVVADKIDIASDVGKLQLQAIVNRYLDEVQKGK